MAPNDVLDVILQLARDPAIADDQLRDAVRTVLQRLPAGSARGSAGACG